MSKTKKKTILLIASVLILLVLVVVKISTNNKTPNNSPQSSVSLSSENSLNNEKNKIINTNPKNNATNVIDNSLISFYFNLELSEDFKKTITVVTKPEFKFSAEWVDKTTLTIKPDSPLNKLTKYSISVNSSETKIFDLVFTTNKYSSPELNIQAKKQINDDLKFAKSLEDFHKENPWDKFLPIKTSEYIIVYDFNKNQFIIGINDPQVAETKNDKVQRALRDIKKIYPQLKDNDYYVLPK